MRSCKCCFETMTNRTSERLMIAFRNQREPETEAQVSEPSHISDLRVLGTYGIARREATV